MIKNIDIIVVGIQAWDIEIGSNCKNIATEFAKHNRVLYVNPPLDRITSMRKRKSSKIQKRIRIRKGFEEALVPISENLWNLYPPTITESINFIGQAALFDFFNKRNGKRFCSDISNAISILDFKDYIIFNDSSMFLGQHIKAFLKPVFYTYYMRDFLIKNPYWKKNGVRLEPKLIKQADCVVNNSILYAEYGREFTANSYMVGQGCDNSLFNDQIRDILIPEDLVAIRGPIVGYVGFLSSRRLSIDIIEHIAKKRKDWSIVLVGQEDDAFAKSDLHNMKNVYFLGNRDTSELPNYIKGFDVAINPQLINDATIGNYPRKIDEYLAMGKPIVASATKAMEYFKEYTYLGITPEDYVELIKKALLQDSSEKQEARRNYELSHSWENNVKEIYNCILKVQKAIA